MEDSIDEADMSHLSVILLIITRYMMKCAIPSQ